MTLNDTWGYAKNDHHWKSSEDLIRKLVDIASKGGNFLLNVGPMDTGDLTPETYARLADMGTWMAKNRESIHGTTGSPFAKLPYDGRMTKKGNTLYAHIFHWNGNSIELPALQNKIKSVRVLKGEKLAFTLLKEEGNSRTYQISKPNEIDNIATVIEIK